MKTKPEHSKEVTEERVSFYENQVLYLTKNNATEQAIETSKKLLSFWTKYKEKYY